METLVEIDIIREEPVYPPIKRVVLNLTQEEASILSSLCEYISGSDKLKARRFTDNLGSNLSSLGFGFQPQWFSEESGVEATK